jgi:hypothetical protein
VLRTTGITARAGELGFKLERFDVGAGELTVPRLDSILHTRGISGLVLLPTWDEPDLSALDWSRLAGVYTDYIIERPKLHAVCSDQYRSLLEALQRLRGMVPLECGVPRLPGKLPPGEPSAAPHRRPIRSVRLRPLVPRA